MQFLSKAKNQQQFAEANHEYPVNGKGISQGYLKAFNGFKVDSLTLENLGINNAKAVEVFQEANWN